MEPASPPVGVPRTARERADEWLPRGRDPRLVELVTLLRTAARQVVAGPDAVLADHGLHRGQFDVLAALYRAGTGRPVTQADLADRMVVTPAGMKKRLDGLLSGGLVSRSPDPADARRLGLRRTAAGERLLESLLDDFFAAEAAAVARLDEAGRAELLGLLRVLVGEPAPGRDGGR